MSCRSVLRLLLLIAAVCSGRRPPVPRTPVTIARALSAPLPAVLLAALGPIVSNPSLAAAAEGELSDAAQGFRLFLPPSFTVVKRNVPPVTMR